jgi:ribonuclease E
VIRDLYDKEIDEVLVEGEDAYKEAKAFMRMLMPSHAKKVQHYRDATPLFLRHQVESQLEAIHSPSRS